MLQDWKERWKARSRRVRRKIELLRLKRIRQKKNAEILSLQKLRYAA